MKVLVITPFLPFPEISGSRQRTMTLLRSLREHDVALAAFRDEDEEVREDVLRPLCGEGLFVFPRPRVRRARVALNLLSPRPLLLRRFARKDARRFVRALLASDGYDCVVAESLLVAEYARRDGRPYRVYDAHNIETRRAAGRARATRDPLRKPVYAAIAARFALYERRALRDFDLGLACSPVDRAAYRRLAPGRRVEIVPNAVDTSVVRPARECGLPGPNGCPTVVFTGTLWYGPNEDAARRLGLDIFPGVRAAVPDARLVIAGDSPPPAIRGLSAWPGVTVEGPVDDIRTVLARGHVFAAPIRSGSGTRQKILEAMAAGLPVVSTAKGCEGLDLEDGRHLLLAESERDFRAAVVRLLGDGDLRERLGRAGRERVAERYSRDAVVRETAALWRSVEREIGR